MVTFCVLRKFMVTRFFWFVVSVVLVVLDVLRAFSILFFAVFALWLSCIVADR